MSDREDKPPLMSAGLRAFLWHRLVELSGLVLIVVSVCFLIVLLTASDTDPSFNTASARDMQNWFGAWGANLAELLYQSFGLAAFGLVIAPLVWGARLFTRKQLPVWKWRLPVLVLDSARNG